MLGKHRELLRFAVVGGASFVITMTITYGLKFTVLTDKPVTALMIGVLVAAASPNRPKCHIRLRICPASPFTAARELD